MSVGVAQQVGQASLDGVQVLCRELGLGHAAVVLEGAHRCNQHHRVGAQACHAALDVQELLRAQVRTEAGLGHHVVSQLQGRSRGLDGVAAVGDVGEGAAVHEGGVVLQRLHQVGLDGVLQKGRAGALGVNVGNGDGLAVVGVGDDHAAQARLEVHEVGRQAEDGHDLRGHGDVEAVLARHAVGDAAHAVDDVPELAIVHVHRALPHDATRVDVEGVALLDVVVQHGSDEVVGVLDGVEVTGEVQVDVLHGDHLRVAATSRAALDAKDGAKGGLAQAEHGVLAQLAQGIVQTDGRGGLALARRGGVDGGDQNELALCGCVLEGVNVNLGLVVSVELQLLLPSLRDE